MFDKLEFEGDCETINNQSELKQKSKEIRVFVPNSTRYIPEYELKAFYHCEQ